MTFKLSWQTIALLISTLLMLPPTVHASTQAVILMYHHFGDDTPTSTSVTLKQFEQHLNYLNEQNYNIWPLSKLINAWKTNQSVPPKTVVLTADDAYKSVYEQAYPRLKRLGWSMTIFVNSEPIDQGFKNFMTWPQMRTMQADGFEFANHSHRHKSMIPQTDETDAMFIQRITQDVQLAQTRLQQELGTHTNTEPKLFAYPYGEYTETAANTIKSMGYTALAQVSGAVDAQSDRRALNRFPMAVSYAELDDFKLKIQTLPLPLVSVEPFDPLISANPPRMTIKLHNKVDGLQCFDSQGQPLHIEWQSDTWLRIQAPQALKPPRDRYACTAPSDQPGRWYWWGHPWVIPE